MKPLLKAFSNYILYRLLHIIKYVLATANPKKNYYVTSNCITDTQLWSDSPGATMSLRDPRTNWPQRAGFHFINSISFFFMLILSSSVITWDYWTEVHYIINMLSDGGTRGKSLSLLMMPIILWIKYSWPKIWTGILQQSLSTPAESLNNTTSRKAD